MAHAELISLLSPLPPPRSNVISLVVVYIVSSMKTFDIEKRCVGCGYRVEWCCEDDGLNARLHT